MLSLLVPLMAQVRRDELLKEVRENQLVAQSRAGPSRLGERAVLMIGGWLVSTGLRLQARYKPEMQPATKSCGSACR